ncbi:MAG: ATP-grasp domain-containing protein [Chloroflexota bacterium]
MIFLFPHNPLASNEADGPYQAEFLALRAEGAHCALFDYDMLDFQFRPQPGLPAGADVLYRGWMLSPAQYHTLESRVRGTGASLLINQETYLRAHHMPSWYEHCRAFTPETYFFPHDDHLEASIDALGWDAYFIKDFVKSNSTARGSIAHSPAEAIEIVNLIETYRGEIEGGIAVRRVEPFLADTEERFFVFKGKPHAPSGDIPSLVLKIAEQIDSPFYSIDTIKREDGELRLVEIGDGQVSDKKRWPLERFVKMLLSG